MTPDAPPPQSGLTTGKVAGGAVGMLLALTLAIGGLKSDEGKRNATYLDIAAVPTACYGQTGAAVKLGQVRTDGECEALLSVEAERVLGVVLRCIRRELQPHEAAALTRFAYNIGDAGLCNSTVARRANAGRPPAEWCEAMEMWTSTRKNGVKVSCRDPANKCMGLVYRRQRERAQCEGRA
jgi:lysozyme